MWSVKDYENWFICFCAPNCPSLTRPFRPFIFFLPSCHILMPTCWTTYWNPGLMELSSTVEPCLRATPLLWPLYSGPNKSWVSHFLTYRTLMQLFYLPTQISFLIRGECVMCHGSKLANSQGKQQLDLLTHTWSGDAPWNYSKFAVPAGVKQIRFFTVPSQFGGITKTTWWLAPWETVSCVSPWPQCSPWFCLAKHWKSQENKTHSFPWVSH